MPEVLGPAGSYFDPESSVDAAAAMRGLFASPERRADLAVQAYRRAQEYSWKRCSDMTFAFIAEVGKPV